MQMQALTIEHVWNPNLAEARRIVSDTRPFRQDDVNWMKDQLHRLYKRQPALFTDIEAEQLGLIVGCPLKRRNSGKMDRAKEDAETIFGLVEQGEQIGSKDLQTRFGWSRSRANFALAALRDRCPGMKTGRVKDSGGYWHAKYWLEE